MSFTDELYERLALRRQDELSLSNEAYQELCLAVKQNPDSFLQDAHDVAFKQLVDTLKADEAARKNEEFLDDFEYETARDQSIERLRAGCNAALAIDSDCLDAQLILALTSSREAYVVMRELQKLCVHAGPGKTFNESPADTLFKAEDFANRNAYLRLLASLSRSEVECACYSLARKHCESLLKLDPSDARGARYTLAITLARLEDEQAFNALDARFARQGNAWSHLARTLLMFKSNRLGAAKRALHGFASLCRGGSYALLRPIYVETYIPDRPSFDAGSFEEAVLAVHECDPVVMDTPDFLGWASSQDDFSEQAKKFARDNDLDW